MTAEAALVGADRLLGGRIRLSQPVKGYRVAIDPVLLAAAVPSRGIDLVLDAGAGTGAASLCLAARLADCRIVALERDPEMLALLERNVRDNGFSDRIRVLGGDLADPPAELRRLTFDLVMTNPPYGAAGRGTPAAPERRSATVESLPLATWIAACLRRLAPRGHLLVIHRGDRLAELVRAVAAGCGDLRLFPLWPRGDAGAANRLLLLARKGVRSPSRLLRGLVLHRPDGGFTPEAAAVLREAAALELLPPDRGETR